MVAFYLLFNFIFLYLIFKIIYIVDILKKEYEPLDLMSQSHVDNQSILT